MKTSKYSLLNCLLSTNTVPSSDYTRCSFPNILFLILCTSFQNILFLWKFSVIFLSHLSFGLTFAARTVLLTWFLFSLYCSYNLILILQPHFLGILDFCCSQPHPQPSHHHSLSFHTLSATLFIPHTSVHLTKALLNSYYSSSTSPFLLSHHIPLVHNPLLAFLPFLLYVKFTQFQNSLCLPNHLVTTS